MAHALVQLACKDILARNLNSYIEFHILIP